MRSSSSLLAFFCHLLYVYVATEWSYLYTGSIMMTIIIIMFWNDYINNSIRRYARFYCHMRIKCILHANNGTIKFFYSSLLLFMKYFVQYILSWSDAYLRPFMNMVVKWNDHRDLNALYTSIAVTFKEYIIRFTLHKNLKRNLKPPAHCCW